MHWYCLGLTEMVAVQIAAPLRPAREAVPCCLQQVRKCGRADLGFVLHQVFKWKVTGSNGDNWDSVRVCGFDVPGSIADDTNSCTGSGEFASLLGGISDQFGANGELIAEAAEAEPLAKACPLHLDPADHLQISGGEAEDCAPIGKVLEGIFDPGHQLGLHLMLPSRHVVADGFRQCGKLGFQHLRCDAGQFTGFAKNGSIRVSS
jgi:hypothetical protein